MTASEQPRGARGLGEFLVEAGAITDDARREAEYSREATGRRLGVVLVERNLISGGRMAQMLSYHFSLPWVSLEHVRFSPKLLEMIPRELAERYGVVPVHLRRAQNGRMTLYVATDDPTSQEAVRACREASGVPVRLMVATPADIQMTIAEEYGEPEAPATKRYDNAFPNMSAEGQSISGDSVSEPASPSHPVAPPARQPSATVPDYTPAPRTGMASVPEYTPAPRAGMASVPEYTPAPRTTMASVPEYTPAPRTTMASVPEYTPAPRTTMASVPECTPAPRTAMASVPEYTPAPRTAMASDTRFSPAFRVPPPPPSATSTATPNPERRSPSPEPRAKPPSVAPGGATRATSPDLSAELADQRPFSPPPPPRRTAPNLPRTAVTAIDIVSPAVAQLRSSPPPPPVAPAEAEAIDLLDVEEDDETAPEASGSPVRVQSGPAQSEDEDEDEDVEDDEDFPWDDAEELDDLAGGGAPPPPPPPVGRSVSNAASMPPPAGLVPPPPPPPQRRIACDSPFDNTPAPRSGVIEVDDDDEDDEDVDPEEWMPPRLGETSYEVTPERSGERMVNRRSAATIVSDGPNDQRVESVVPTPRSVSDLAVILVVGAQPAFVARTEKLAARLRARVQSSALMSAEARLRECRPFALIVPEEVYGFDRYAFTKLGILAGIPVLVWTDELDEDQAFDLLRVARHASERR